MPSTERLNDLFAANARVQRMRDENDLLERLIMDKDGVDLRAVVSKVGELVQHSAAEYNLLHDRMQAAMEKRREGALSSFVHQKFGHEDLAVMKHMFTIAVDNNPNDDKARVAQLAIVFMALTLEVDVRNNLTTPPRHVDRFVNSDAIADTATDQHEQQARERANQIQRGPLVMFLKNDARQLMQKCCGSMIDLRTYVSECVSLYMSYKHSACPRVAAQYYETN